jgi:hypothetical protein
MMPAEKKSKGEEEGVVTVMIVKNQSLMPNNFGQSYSVIVPPGYGLGIFKRLVYSGCKAIGHKEFLSIMLECGKPVFPEDFPQSRLGMEHHKLQS